MTRRIDTASCHVPASPATVFATMTDADRVARWIAPEGMVATIHAFDPRPGGDYRMTLTYCDREHAQGKAGEDRDEVVGRFVAVEADRLIEQAVEFPSDDPANAGVMTMRWTIASDGEGSRVTVEAIDVPPAIDADVHRRALGETLAKLAAEATR